MRGDSTQADVTFDRTGGTVLARIVGEIDMANAAEMQAALVASLAGPDLGLVVDLTDVGYLDSAGIRLLFALHEDLSRRGQALRVVVPEDAHLRRVLLLTRLDAVVHIHATVGDALPA